jgi:hypothetical protein
MHGNPLRFFYVKARGLSTHKHPDKRNAMETPWREWLKKAKIVYWLIMGGLTFFVVAIILATLGTLSWEQIPEFARWYFFLLIAGTLLQMIARRL